MLLRDPLVQVLALKLSKLASEQSGIALNIPPMAQNFGGPEVNQSAVKKVSKRRVR
jgi:hypothetical protein